MSPHDWNYNGVVQEEVVDDDSCPVFIYRIGPSRWEKFLSYITYPAQVVVGAVAVGYYRLLHALRR